MKLVTYRREAGAPAVVGISERGLIYALAECQVEAGGHPTAGSLLGLLAQGPSALAAARCAVDIQRTLHDRNASLNRPGIPGDSIS